VWVSAVRPGRTSGITACRHDRLTAHLRAAGLGAVADLGFVGLDEGGPDADPAVITGYKATRNRPLTRGQQLSDKALAAVRPPVEHGFAHLKNWRMLGKVRTDPKWATALVPALMVLTNQEVARCRLRHRLVVRASHERGVRETLGGCLGGHRGHPSGLRVHHGNRLAQPPEQRPERLPGLVAQLATALFRSGSTSPATAR